ASSLAECRSHLSSSSIQTVVTDYRLKRGDGHQVLQTARSYHPQVPVILVTAFADKRMAIKSANLHVFALLDKPIELPHFKKTVSHALQFFQETCRPHGRPQSDRLLL